MGVLLCSQVAGNGFWMVIYMAAWKGGMAGEKGSLLGKQVVPNTRGLVEKRIASEEACLSTTPSVAQVQKEEEDVDVNLSEVYFLIMHFLSSGPCSRATGQLWNELLQHKLLPRRYHAWFSRTGVPSGDEDDDGMSFPLSYIQVLERLANKFDVSSVSSQFVARKKRHIR